MAFWSGVADRYGGIAQVPLKGRRVYSISDPTLLYELLVTNRKKYRKNTRYKAAVDTFGAGLLLNEGDAWKRQRRATQPTFKADFVETRVAALNSLTARFLDRWNAPAERGEIRDVEPDFLDLSQTLAGHYLMGPGFAAIETGFRRAALAIKDNWPLPPRHVLALWRPRDRVRERRLERAIADIDTILLAYVAEQRERDFTNCGVLEVIARASRAAEPPDDRSLRDQLLTLFFAGHETSASSLTWIHYLLSAHTDVRKRFQLEVRTVLGARPVADARDLSALELTERIISESLRLYSPIHSISRVALEDDIVGGYLIPRGAMIYVSLHAVHRNPAIWPEPERFDPGRFKPEAVAARPRFAFIPFAGGHRNCIGGAMAMTELKLALAQVAQRFVLDLAPGHRVEPRAATTMHPRHGMRMQIRKRDGR